jgi:site-specific recombinase XerD
MNENRSLTGRYREYLLERGWGEQSMEGYLRAVRYAAEKLGGEENLLAATDEDITAVAAERVFRRDSADLSDWCSQIRHFFDFLIASGRRPDSPVRGDLARLFLGDARATKAFRLRQGRRPSPDFERLRERAVAALIRDAGVRPEELQAVEVGWYRPKQQLLVLPPRKRRVPLDDTAAAALEDYLDVLRISAPAPVTGKSLLFIHAGCGGALSEQDYWDVIRTHMRRGTG